MITIAHMFLECWPLWPKLIVAVLIMRVTRSRALWWLSRRKAHEGQWAGDWELPTLCYPAMQMTI
ncbi:MAG: hypothetical protein JOZ19_15415 [Rubrobacter sp.]|nr:hypothetical protein [Rubrobacter sp.]